MVICFCGTKKILGIDSYALGNKIGKHIDSLILAGG